MWIMLCHKSITFLLSCKLELKKEGSKILWLRGYDCLQKGNAKMTKLESRKMGLRQSIKISGVLMGLKTKETTFTLRVKKTAFYKHTHKKFPNFSHRKRKLITFGPLKMIKIIIRYQW